jgi:hypothetical protein
MILHVWCCQKIDFSTSSRLLHTATPRVAKILLNTSEMLATAATFVLSISVLEATTTFDSPGASVGLGDGLWRTFGHQTALPLTVDEALAQKWNAISKCEPDLGILYTQDRNGPSEAHPLGLRFTASGKIAGVQATVFGSNKFGDAAQKNLINKGYWKPTANATKTWHIDVSFRAPEDMCSMTTRSEELLGDRVVINQDSIKQKIPLTAKEAVAQNWTPGSCMASMGWHHFYDLKSAPKQTFEEDQILPLIPMYNPPDSTGVLNAFFFPSPVAQPGSANKYLLSGAADWESPALVESAMCLNWCDESCQFETTSWATMHIYVSSAWKTLTCPHGSGPVGRSCEL